MRGISGIWTSATIGGAVGYVAIRISGFKAAGMTGGGSGVGGSAINVGVAFGTVAGVAVYGVCQTAAQEYRRIKEKKEEEW